MHVSSVVILVSLESLRHPRYFHRCNPDNRSTYTVRYSQRKKHHRSRFFSSSNQEVQWRTLNKAWTWRVRFQFNGKPPDPPVCGTGHLAIRLNTPHPHPGADRPAYLLFHLTISTLVRSPGILPRCSWETTSWRDSKLRAKPSVVNVSDEWPIRVARDECTYRSRSIVSTTASKSGHSLMNPSSRRVGTLPDACGLFST